MRLAEPNALHLLWLLLPLSGFFWWRYFKRQSQIQAFAQPALMKTLLSRYRPRRWILKFILLSITLVLAVIALSRPQWGFEWQDIEQKGVDILLAVDTSKSMLTRDVSPNRLERTKLAIKDLIKQTRGDRVGLIAFAGEAFLMCPLTVDYSGFAISLNDLGVDSIPRGGTDLATAIKEAIRIYEDEQSSDPVLIIITDGDNLEGDPLDAARRAKAQGIKIFTVGIGTAEGELIQIANEQGELSFLKDADGNFVKSRLNEKLLKDIAMMADGFFIKSAGANFGLDYIYKTELQKYDKQTFATEREKRFYERFQWPLVLALVMLLCECFISPFIAKS